MPRKIVSTDKAPAAIGPYSQAVKAGGMVFISGQIPLNPRTGEMVGGDDIEAQTTQVMKNLVAILEASGSSLKDVIKSSIYLTDLGDFGTVNKLYGSHFEGMEPPARACVQVAALPKGAKVEIDMIALAE